MKKIITIAIILASFVAKGQQTPQYTQYMLNYLALNPAMAGMKKCIDVKIGYRAQWMGFDGKPTTAFTTISSRINFKKSRSPYSYHGIGAKVEDDHVGLTATTKIYLAYAYHFSIFRDFKASFGVYGGIQQFRFKFGESNVFQGPDPAIQSGASRIIWPDFTPGFFMYNDKMFFGLDIRQLLLNKIKGYGTGVNRFKQHYEFLLGAKVELDDRFSYIPSMMLKFTALSVPAVDLNLLVDYDDRFQFGFSYRNTDALAVMFKVNFLEHFTLGYSFDLTTSKIRMGSSNTHEIVIGLYTCNVRGGDNFSCPIFD
ncbi:MAG: type IX secretion system membrane protein PorP/SprF [Flavobacteriales bacterium]|nr:type IX secretion system membrane protein PorP/SprF [Flavobacteriales bacterium]